MLPSVDRKSFFAELKTILGIASWTPQQVAGLDRLLDGFERDPLVPDGRVGIRRSAYWIYTSWHETGHTFTPVQEKGSAAYFVRMYGASTRRGRALGNDTDAEAIAYSGKGDVQLTGESNYEQLEAYVREHYPWIVEQFEREIGRPFDLTVGDQPGDARDPEGALYPPVSYVALVAGTTFGMFGPSIGRFINDRGCDYYNARRSVNLLDHASRWSTFCPKIERALARAVELGAATSIPADAAPASPVAPAAVVENAGTVVTTAPMPAAAPVPVPGGGPTDPPAGSVKPLWQKITGWVGGTGISFTGLKEIIVSLQADVQKWVFVAFALVAAVVLVAIVLDHIFSKWVHARPDLQNVKG